MTQRRVLVLLLALSLVSSMVDVVVEGRAPLGSGWTVVSAVLFSLLVFSWYRLDSDARGYRRSALLNVGVIGFGIVAVPYYLLRSRPSGEKGRALLRLLGFCLLMFAAAAIGVGILDLLF